jgi:pyruvate/2-oxoglutarate dehydrogenase complex dihydrolipoamide dehydrogenase (E3) component
MASHALKHEPLDAYNLALTENLHPTGWVNPTPADRYNMVVIGAGTAGLVTAAGAAILGAKVALVERDLMGGDCLNFGCVPSKALIRSARAAAAVRDAGRFGVEVPAGMHVNFPAVMERMRQLRVQLSPTDSANRFRGLGVDVFIGDARFVAPDCVEVDGKRLKFKKAAITTGARAASLPISGLAEAGYLTNETVFSLTELPRQIAVIGAGPIGCELAQTFARFGAQVTLLEVAPQILIREDRDAADRIERAIVRDGVELITGCKISRVEVRGGKKVITTERNGGRGEVAADEILIGVGRVPAVDALNLEAAMIEYDKQNGVKVDDHLRTTNPLVYAGGDVASPYKFTHLSDAHARIILRNALFFGRQRASALTIPWCTYTDPEIAHVGLYEAEARQRGIAVANYTQELAEVDRAVLDGETDGFVKVHVREGTDRIVGATIVASHAGEMISELTTAIKAGVGLGTLGDVIHPYPTQADAIRRAAGLYTRTRLTPFVAGLMKRWFAFTR